MKEYVSAAMFRGGNRNNIQTRKERRRLQKLITRQRQVYGRRPGRADEIEKESRGHFAKLDRRKRGNVCRMYFQNVRTLKMEGDTTKGPFGILKAAGVDIVGISEINKNWDHPIIKRRYEKGIHKIYPGAEIAVASNADYRPTGMQKPGGIMTVISRDVRDKVESGGNDPMGRWARVVATFEEVQIAIYTVYIPQTGGLGGH